MKTFIRPLLSFSLLVLLISHTGFGKDNPCFPKKNNKQLVYDESHLLSSGQDALLDTKLVEFARSTSNQIVVVIVNDLCNMEPSQYATELLNNWGVGTQKNNGIVLLVKVKTAESRGQVFIAIGRGLEGAIPDAVAHLIVENELIPNFKNGDYYSGINDGTNVLMQLAQGEYSDSEYAKRHEQGWKRNSAEGIISIIIALLIIGVVILVRALKVKRYARLNHLDWWTAFWLLNSTTRQHRGYFDDFTRGSGGFGGGGGFGGFGGGSSGGGGAGGSW
ncbi:MAG: TPM domain-containing protein [Crocinitomicaceae bacterium]|nr:TPM domain-containing protein [Crocinitomicaceae bacterium]